MTTIHKHKGTDSQKISYEDLSDTANCNLLMNKAIGTTQTTIAHNLSRTPDFIFILPLGNGTVWRSANSDATNIYLTASAAINCDILVAYIKNNP